MSVVQQRRQLLASRGRGVGNMTQAAPLNRVSRQGRRYLDIYVNGKFVKTNLIRPVTQQTINGKVFGLSTPREHLNAGQRRVQAA
jgi:hypothetical protein